MKKVLIFIFGLCFFVSVQNAVCLTLSTIRTEIRRGINDDPSDTTFQRYSSAYLLTLINEAQREINTFGDLADRTTSYVLKPGTTYYDLPSDVVATKQVYFVDTSLQRYELDQIPQKSLFDKDPQWDRNAGQPNKYWVSQATNPQNQQSAPLRISYIPIPGPTSTGTVTIWYSYQFSNLSSDTDVPFDNRLNLVPYHYAIVYYVIGRIKTIEGRLDEAQVYFTLYINAVNSMRSKLGELPNYTPNIAIPGVNR